MQPGVSMSGAGVGSAPDLASAAMARRSGRRGVWYRTEECAEPWSLGIHWKPKGGDGSWKPDQRLGWLSKRDGAFRMLDVLRCCAP